MGGEEFPWLSGSCLETSRARGCHLVSLKAAPAKGPSVTLGFVAVSRKQECEPHAAGFSVEKRLPSAFVSLLLVEVNLISTGCREAKKSLLSCALTDKH